MPLSPAIGFEFKWLGKSITRMEGTWEKTGGLPRLYLLISFSVASRCAGVTFFEVKTIHDGRGGWETFKKVIRRTILFANVISVYITRKDRLIWIKLQPYHESLQRTLSAVVHGMFARLLMGRRLGRAFFQPSLHASSEYACISIVIISAWAPNM